MAPTTPPTPRWQPTWGRLLGTTGVAFFLVLALLVARVQAGADPAVGHTPAAAPATTDPVLPGPGSSVAPGGSSATPGGASVDPGFQDADPPRTHAS